MHTYDFNYSMNFGSMPKGLVPQNDQERQLIELAKQFLESGMVKGQEVEEFVRLLIRQKIFSMLGSLLSQIGQVEFIVVGHNMEKRDRLQSLRQKLCECIKEVNIVLGRQRQYYINVIILVLTLVLARLLNEKHGKKIEKGVIFHMLNWELKGQHSTDTFYHGLEKDFLIQDKILEFSQGRIVKKKSMQNSTSFRDLKGSVQLVKVKQPMSGFALALSKQNQNIHNSMLPNMLNFRKKSEKLSARNTSRRPNIFEDVQLNK